MYLEQDHKFHFLSFLGREGFKISNSKKKTIPPMILEQHIRICPSYPNWTFWFITTPFHYILLDWLSYRMLIIIKEHIAVQICKMLDILADISWLGAYFSKKIFALKQWVQVGCFVYHKRFNQKNCFRTYNGVPEFKNIGIGLSHFILYKITRYLAGSHYHLYRGTRLWTSKRLRKAENPFSAQKVKSLLLGGY